MHALPTRLVKIQLDHMNADASLDTLEMELTVELRSLFAGFEYFDFNKVMFCQKFN